MFVTVKGTRVARYLWNSHRMFFVTFKLHNCLFFVCILDCRCWAVARFLCKSGIILIMISAIRLVITDLVLVIIIIRAMSFHAPFISEIAQWKNMIVKTAQGTPCVCLLVFVNAATEWFAIIARKIPFHCSSHMTISTPLGLYFDCPYVVIWR